MCGMQPLMFDVGTEKLQMVLLLPGAEVSAVLVALLVLADDSRPPRVALHFRPDHVSRHKSAPFVC